MLAGDVLGASDRLMGQKGAPLPLILLPAVDVVGTWFGSGITQGGWSQNRLKPHGVNSGERDWVVR